MTSPSSCANLLRSLCRSNTALLHQKVGLLDALTARHGPAATEMFTKPCSIVGATIGQHFRHSMDHMELAVLVASARCNEAMSVPSSDYKQAEPAEIHYDLRVRGGTLEKDMEESRKRMVSVVDVLDEISNAVASSDTNANVTEELASHIIHSPVHAQFYLTADEGEESKLPSTVGRELGFVAHHAIHHMAMVKVIALQSAGLDEEELPDGFGRAPSTIKYDRS
eukprot:CAMPEP_0181035756 /NCGR_PEP_ID=MMETSP1070-20121207/8489_1 /TAXON_ID=265543 /ORGANISM="Minutocellus polymorphus, Strain NH13" /LENGTH=223 /DNA_ID=CAMNT_0023113329 /DNA_START=155 /DNA_END=826 /DNA_ORIENTATION=-